MIYRVLYISRPAEGITADDVKDIVVTSQKNNREKKFTGALIYRGDEFMQVLEGEKEPLRNLVEKIKTDPRHTDFYIVDESEAESRAFDQWSLGYLHLDEEEESKLKEFSNLLDRGNPIEKRFSDCNFALRMFTHLLTL